MLGKVKKVNFRDYKHINKNDRLNYYSSTCDVTDTSTCEKTINLSFEEKHIHKHTDRDTTVFD